MLPYMGDRLGDREHWCTSDLHIIDEMHSVVPELGVRRHQQMAAMAHLV